MHFNIYITCSTNITYTVADITYNTTVTCTTTTTHSTILTCTTNTIHNTIVYNNPFSYTWHLLHTVQDQ